MIKLGEERKLVLLTLTKKATKRKKMKEIKGFFFLIQSRARDHLPDI
jgi:hypothetical protein